MTRLTALSVLIPVSFFAQESPSISVKVRLVNVSFSARDTAGRLVTSLEREDIEAFDDGVQARIDFFAKGTESPLSLGLIVDGSGSQERVCTIRPVITGVCSSRPTGSQALN